MVAGSAVVAAASAAGETTAPTSPARALLEAAGPSPTSALLEDVLDHNPEIAAARALAAAAAQRAPQVRSLPDPMAALTLYLQTPETRVGPQHAMIAVSQRIPWFGTLGVRGKVAVAEAAAAAADVAAIELEKVTDARIVLQELSFLDTRRQILLEEGETLDHFEELARARYTTGVGLEPAAVKIQAEITRNEAALLDLEVTRADLEARLDRLGDRSGTPVPPQEPPDGIPFGSLDVEQLRAAALAGHPEVLAARARLEAAERRVELADKAFVPELSAGITYSAVGSRPDANPPDEGKDVLGVTGGVTLPVWRKRLHAGVEEAVQARLAAEERLRGTLSSVDEEIADLTRRIPLIADRLELFEEVLIVQAEEALSSTLAAYSVGTAGALELLDAERLLFQVRVEAARSRTDYANAVARLERAVARPTGGGA